MFLVRYMYMFFECVSRVSVTTLQPIHTLQTLTAKYYTNIARPKSTLSAQDPVEKAWDVPQPDKLKSHINYNCSS